MNPQLFYAPIGCNDVPIPFDGEMEIKEFPVEATTHGNGLSSFSCQMSARIKRFSIKTNQTTEEDKETP